MSAGEKQKYLREHIIEKDYDAELFINFLEEKKEDGANIDAWSFEELKAMVDEYVLEMGRGSIVRRMTDSSTKLKVFGDDNKEKIEAEEEKVEEKEEIEEEKKIEEVGEDDEESDDTYDNYGKDVTHPQGGDNSSDEEEEKDDEEEEKDDEEDKNDDKEEKKEDEKNVEEDAEEDDDDSSSSSSSSDDENEEEEEEENAMQEMAEQTQEMKDEEKKESKYYSKRTVARYVPTQLVDQPKIDVEVSNPEIIKRKGLKGSYTVYSVKTSPFGWIVKRRYSDFEWVYNCLIKRFPANYVKIFHF